MKRYHEEKQIIEGRAKKYRQIHASYIDFTNSLPSRAPHVIEEGRYRKSLRCGGCSRARCQLCHPEKYPKRKPTRQERQNKRDLTDE